LILNEKKRKQEGLSAEAAIEKSASLAHGTLEIQFSLLLFSSSRSLSLPRESRSVL
jgi:hypothetical protein